MPLIIPVQLNSPFKVDISSTEHSNRILTIVKSRPTLSTKLRCSFVSVKDRVGTWGTFYTSQITPVCQRFGGGGGGGFFVKGARILPTGNGNLVIRDS